MKSIKNITHRAWSGFLLFMLLPVSFYLASCSAATDQLPEKEEHDHEHEEGAMEEVHLSAAQVEALGVKADTMPLRNMTSYVEANGQLGIFPQNQALVTPVVGANVASIQVVEGEKVRQGQVLARLRHPNLLQWQMDYLDRWHRAPALEKEYRRQKELYDQKIGSAKAFEDARAAWQAINSELKGLETRLRMLGMDIARIQRNELYRSIALTSPIPGYIKQVFVKTGQYVQPETPLFEVVNNDRIHVDIMVFEKDMYKVKKGQKVKFFIETLPEEELEATIYAVGKAFEQDPKALHLHAEIDNKKGLLIPGTYVRARILTDAQQTYALPEAALAREGERYFFFLAEAPQDPNGEWHFQPIEAIPGTRSDGWIAITPAKELPKQAQIALNGAYYLLAEMKKGEVGHEH